MSAAPLVSIGLPVYNGERFLAQAIDSLLGQTLTDLELIISDNASTDRTAEIGREHAARYPRIRYIRQRANIGAIANWNFVARQARGRYFKWASANDFCDPRMLEKCVAVMSADPGIVLCHGRTCIVDEDSGERRPCTADISATEPRPSERFQSVARNLVLNNEASGVMRLDALRRTALVRPYEGGDLVLTIELSLYGRIVLLPEVLYYRRVGRETDSMQLERRNLRDFLYAGSGGRPGFERWRRRIDLARAVLAAPIGPSEKLRTLLQAAPRVIRKVIARRPALSNSSAS